MGGRVLMLLALFSGVPGARAALPADLLRMQDRRDAAGVAALFEHGDPSVRAAAAWSSGSIQDALLTDGLVRLLSDPAAEVREAAAFALGQSGAVLTPEQSRSVTGHLLDRIAERDAVPVLLRCAEAAGKLADSTGVLRLAGLCDVLQPSAVDWEIALSIGRCAYRNVRHPLATAAVVRLLDQHTGPERWKAAWALMRIGNPEMLRDHADRIAAAVRSADPDVRMFAAAALGRVADRRVSLLTLLDILREDADWRVRVSAARSLGQAARLVPQEALPALLVAAEDSSEHVSLAALEALGDAAPWPAAQREQVALDLTAIAGNEDGSWSRRQERGALLALARGSGGDALRLARMSSPPAGPGRSAIYEALAAVSGDEAADILAAGVQDEDVRAARTAAEALGTWITRERPGPEFIGRVRTLMVQCLASTDPPLAATAAGVLSDSLLRDPSLVPPLLQAVAAAEPGGDPEILGVLVDALGAQKDALALPTLAAIAGGGRAPVARRAAAAMESITGRSHLHLLRRDLPGDTTGFGEGAPDAREVRLVTSRGTVRIELLPGDAPLTCRNFLRLAERGFYRGSVLHRVVPNFVVQGGDPRGDGWGGPGYSIRSEFGRAHYDRGTVGMASAGKDTEGSQFFITHSRQPHLDGRYTVFGRVIGGMEVVDALQVGDRILSVDLP